MTMIKLKIICPVCTTEKLLEFPKSIFEQANEHSTIFFPMGLYASTNFKH